MDLDIGNHISRITLPIPFGAHATKKGTQFTLFSRHATRVWLLFFNAPDARKPVREIALDPELHRLGDIWHIFVPKIRPGQLYLYRLDSDLDIPEASCYNPKQWVLDPYALAVSGSPQWGSAPHIVPAQHPVNGSGFPKCVVVRESFNWGNDTRPGTPLADSIIYETHVRGYTMHPSSRTENPGSYAGLIEKIPYLRRLGVTSIELLPLQEFNEMEYLLENNSRRELRNFWGYSTQNFFAPMSRYSASGTRGEQVREFKQLVRACHRAGLEVILDVVFNHTDEGNQDGPVWSFRGIDNSIYYITEPDKVQQTNYTGCGNTVNCNHPVVRSFILDCLRYWHLVMRVDGFRFDLASIMSRGQHGQVLDNPPVVEAIAEDPALRGAKIIAEAWDAAGLYQVGSFPHRRWSEWNGRYRDDIRAFWNDSTPNLRAFVTRLIGSPDLYAHNQQPPQKSINFITCHDGFTLCDLVSYNHKHNEANGEENRDGENNNHSRNYGVEGPTDDPSIIQLRNQQMKNLLATLFLSQGVPMLLAGDEFGRTQQGNNNAYCQDNPVSWVDWTLLDKQHDLHQFVRKLIIFRRTHPTLRKQRYLNDHLDSDQKPDITWHGPENTDVDWDHGSTIACHLYARDNHENEDLFMIFNAHETSQTYYLPEIPDDKAWNLAISTQEKQPRIRRHQKSLRIDPRSVNVFRASLL